MYKYTKFIISVLKALRNKQRKISEHLEALAKELCHRKNG